MKTLPPAIRPLLAPSALLALLLLWSARPVGLDTTGRFVGTATDALHHAWGLWWFAHGEGEGAITRLVSFPTGERGALLSPLVALGSLPWQWLGGPALAYNVACAATLLGACLGVALLCWALSRDPLATALAPLALLVGRPLYAQLGLGVLEGLSLGLPLAALAALILWVERRGGRASSAGVGLVSALAVIENPYALVLLLPITAGAALWRLRREGREALLPLAVATLGGVLPIGLRVLAAGGDLGGNETTAVRFFWAGAERLALEGSGSLDPVQLLSPLPLPDLSASAILVRDQGGDAYLGLTVLGLACAGALLGGGAARAALGVAGLCALLAAGSLPGGQGGPPGPFWFVNLALSQALPPLTQPSRFLSFASAALALSAALGASALSRRGGVERGLGWIALALALEAAWVGGPSLELPATDLRESACMAGLGAVDPGAVHLLAPSSMSRESANTAAVRLQLLHGLPGTHRGIGGWRQEPLDSRVVATLSEIGQSMRRGPSARLPQALRHARQLGFSWLIVANDAAPGWLGAPERSCGGWSAWRLPGYTN